MSTLILQIDPAKLTNPDADIRYALPDLLVARSGGRLIDDGYDYVGEATAPCLLLFLRTDDVQTGIAVVIDVLKSERVLDNDLSEVPVAVEDSVKTSVVHPADFQGTFRLRDGQAILVMGSDEFDLQRFVEAQSHDYESVLHELRSGRKRGHWIWYVFPQIRGLGQSSMSEHYAISSLSEAKAYLEHPLLGKRLRECTEIVVGLKDRSIEQIFPYPDDLKFRSCMTLFAEASPDPNIFQTALDVYFRGEPDALTRCILSKQSGVP
jgi:uncharacterized protein (DUF1810 family)